MANYNIQVASINDSSVRSAAASLASAKATLAKLQNSPTVQDLQIAQAQLEQAKIALQQAQPTQYPRTWLFPLATRSPSTSADAD